MATSKRIGTQAEQIAANYLKSKGLAIITENFSGPQGELDLIAQDKDTLVFVEVRYRKSAGFGLPQETVNWKKQQRIVQTARYFFARHPKWARKASRFDIVAIRGELELAKIDWIKNAFDASEQTTTASTW